MIAGPIYLIGYRGTGKTSVAEVLSEKIGWPWVDADQALEKVVGKSIRQIFDDEGERNFRIRESAVLAVLCQQKESIVATGGGVVLRPENRERLKRGVVVWLQAPAEVIWRRMQADSTTQERRPNLAQGGLAEIEAMLAVREPLYRECAAFTIDSSEDGPQRIADAILGALRIN